MRFSPKLCFVFVLPFLLVWTASDSANQSASQVAGVKMTVSYGVAGMSGGQTIYLQGDRRRMDFRSSTGGAQRADGSIADVRYGPHIASITRCDLGQMFELNLDAREYHAAPYPPKLFTKEQMEARGIRPQSSLPNKPTFLIETRTADTGERKEMFGHTARHVVTTLRQTPLEGSKSEAQETVTDGWYIDLDNRISCDWKWREGKGGHAFVRVRLMNDNAPPEMPKFVDVGKAETGFAVESKTTSRSTYALADGTKKENTSTNETTVMQLEEGPLDPAVFEIPAGFRQVTHIETNPPVDWRTELVLAWERFKARVVKLFDSLS
jgi:hypothetical protein